MLPYKRSKRVADLLRKEVADIIMRRVKDPRLGFVTVTAVEVTDDFQLARVYVSILEKNEAESALKALSSASGFIRTELGRRVRIKALPRLEFLEDKAIEYGERIDTLLRKIREDGEDREDT